jgi:hypothetical protein
MGKMHELLAVEKTIGGRAKAILEETLRTFKDKATEFYTGRIKSYKPFRDDDMNLLPVETKELVDTVPSKLRYTFDTLTEEYDWLLQKESTNQLAKADLIVDGVTLATDLPATFLLALEHRLGKVREVILSTPTLPNGLKWEPDKQKGEDIFKLAEAQISYRATKVTVPFILVPATDKHPAQASKEEKTETIGTYTEMLWDSRVTSAYKSALLERVDKLLVGVQKAIRRANGIDASEAVIGKKIFDFVMQGRK